MRSSALILIAMFLLIPMTNAAPQAAPPLHAGFPRTDATAPIRWSSPTILNLDTDSELEILVGDGGACLWAWNSDGSVVSGYPLTTDPSCDTPAAIEAPLAVGNLDADPEPEILAGTKGVGPAESQRGEVWAWNTDQSIVDGWPRTMAWNESKANGIPAITSLALANAAGDQSLEVYYSTNNNAERGTLGVDIALNLYLRDGAGETIPVYPTWAGVAGIYGAVATTNMTCDRYADVVVGRDHNYLHAYDNFARQPANWPVRTFVDPLRTRISTDPVLTFPRSAPAIGDIDLDGQQEFVIAGPIQVSTNAPTATGVLVVREDGTRMPEWTIPAQAGAPLTTTLMPRDSVALGDIAGDERLEIVVNLPDGTVRAYQADNQQLWSYDYAQGQALFASEPIIGDITGDEQPEILFGTYSPDGSANAETGIIALNASGQLVSGYPITLTAETGEIHGISAAPTLADIDNDGQLDLVVASIPGTLYAWDLEIPVPTHLPWPMSRHDLWRSGNIAGGPDNIIVPGPRGEFVVFLPVLREGC